MPLLVWTLCRQVTNCHFILNISHHLVSVWFEETILLMSSFHLGPFVFCSQCLLVQRNVPRDVATVKIPVKKENICGPTSQKILAKISLEGSLLILALVGCGLRLWYLCLYIMENINGYLEENKSNRVISSQWKSHINALTELFASPNNLNSI